MIGEVIGVGDRAVASAVVAPRPLLSTGRGGRRPRSARLRMPRRGASVKRGDDAASRVEAAVRAATMRLTSYSNFSLRMLMVAAMRAPRLSTVHEVADAFGISRAHLVKCVHQLGQWGYLVNVRGNRGGFRLARPAEAITLGEIVRRTEDGFDLVECFAPATSTCPLIGRCRLSVALRTARDALLAEFDRLTIADVTENGGEILEILGLDGPDPVSAVGCAAERARAGLHDPIGAAEPAARETAKGSSGSMSAAMSSRLQPASSALKAE